MTPRTRRSPRRTEALSRERIVEAAVELLDAAGEGGLTFRALTARLATGPGAVYWHVANKDELLGAATDAVVAAVLAGRPDPAGSPEDEVRAVALGLFDAVDEHPWLAPALSAQFTRHPGGSVVPRVLEAFGRPVRALGVPEDGWFTATSALVHHVLGSAGQNAANGVWGRTGGADGSPLDRAAYLDAAATSWERLDAEEFPFLRAVAGQLRDHDDREQFLAGVDLVLAGITTTRPAAR